jgi:uncharacterized membrane protein
MNGVETSRLERWLGAVLRTGALASGALLAAGLVLELAGVNHRLAAAVTAAGLVILMATPVARVVVSVVEFAIERDWVFLAMTGGVLLILGGSLGVAFGVL